jgi:hypothetical protein
MSFKLIYKNNEKKILQNTGPAEPKIITKLLKEKAGSSESK